MGCLCSNITNNKNDFEVDIKADNNGLSLKERDSLVQEYRKSLENGTKINNNNETDSITFKNLQIKNDNINNNINNKSNKNPFAMANLEDTSQDNVNININKNNFEKYNDIFNDINTSVNKKINNNKRKNYYNEDSNNDIYDLGMYKIKK